MIAAAIDTVFNGTDDDTLQAVDLPMAFLRLVLLLSPDVILWLDSDYNSTSATSVQEGIIAGALAAVSEAINSV